MYYDRRQTFDNFVVGRSNKKAVNAAEKLIEGAADYKALLIYGKTGCGKTHLARAVRQELLDRETEDPRTRAVQMRTVIQFTDELRSWLLAGGTLETFYDNYEMTEVLILEDIQDFERIRSTEKYCMEIIQRLLKQGKCVLLTADRRYVRHWRWKFPFIKTVRMKDQEPELRKQILKGYAETRKVEEIEDAWENQLF